MIFSRTLGDQFGARFTGRGEKDAAIFVKHRQTIFNSRLFKKQRQCGDTCLIGFGSSLKRCQPAHQAIPVKGIIGKGLGQNGFIIKPNGHAKRLIDRIAHAFGPAQIGQHALQATTFAGKLAHDLAKGTFADLTSHDRQGMGQIIITAGSGECQDLFLHIGHGFSGCAIIHDFKMRRQTGFQRKAAQQRLAEGMNGLDFHSARCIQHTGKKLARADGFVATGCCTGKVGEIGLKVAILHRGPQTQSFIHTVGHFGRRGLGKSQTKNTMRLGARKHQAQDAIRQHLGLAGPGRGRHPDRCIGIRRIALQDVWIGSAHFGHDTSPSPPSSASSSTSISSLPIHSRRRARWT